jgi:alpha-galactosidase
MPAISFDPDSGVWLLCTPRTSYAVRVDGTGAPSHLGWGPQLTLPAVAGLEPGSKAVSSSFEGFSPAGEELPVDGGARYGAPSLRVRFADGTRAFEWHHVGYRISEPVSGAAELALEFRDRHYPLTVTLHYRVRQDTDVLERWTELHNRGQELVTLLRADSAAWSLPQRAGYRLSHVTGQWSAEGRLHREPVPHGETVLTSRRGITSHHANPWVMLDAGDATEERGEVWSAGLAWSGSWQITVQRTPDHRLAFTGGAGQDGTSVPLAPGEEYTTPPFAGLYTDGGFGEASRAWHAYALAHVLPHPEELRPVIFNSWEATGFDVTESGQKVLAEQAARLGVELFVMDDGWFGARRDDTAGLGDWTPAAKAFPEGLGPLVDEVHRLGMRFGLWVEPEMVNPDSDLYRAHPEWVLHYPSRTRTELRNQLVLNFARDDVAEWAYGWLTRLVAENGIDFLKWDMNRAFSEAGWPEQAHGADVLWTRYVRNLYRVIDRLRSDHPGLRIETCSGGGGRVDLGILARTDQAWPSDNTDAADRLAIQNSFSQLYPARTMAAWVTDVPNQLTHRSVPLRFRFHVAMSGVLALGGNLTRWAPQELEEAADLVAEYKTIRHLVQHGAQYRLRPPVGDESSAVQYVTADGQETVVFVWQRTPRHGAAVPALRLAGLDCEARYRNVRTGAVHHGSVLTGYGITPDVPHGDWASTVMHLVREN